MNKHFYRRPIKVIRLLIIIAILFQQNSIQANALSSSQAISGAISELNSSVLPAVPTIADRFDYPVGKPNGENYFIACGWLENCGYGTHPAVDYNRGSGNDDEGDAVYSIANGKVLFAGTGKGTLWGKIVLIEHTLFDGKKVWSQYAHLKTVTVNVNDIVTRGTPIGTIGRGYNNKFSAHLHFEIRIQYLKADAWPRGWTVSDIQQYYADPYKYIRDHRVVCPPRLKDKVIFYKNKGYGCGGLGEGNGFQIINPGELPSNIDIGTTIGFQPQSVGFPVPQPSSQTIDPRKTYLIRTMLSSQYVLDANSDPATNVQKSVIQWWWHGQSNQRWQFEKADAVYYRIRSLYNDKCLSVSPLGIVAPGNIVTLASCTGNPTKWSLESLGNGDYRVISAVKSIAGVEYALTLSAAWGNGSAGNVLNIFPVNTSSSEGLNQKWHLCEVNQIKLELKDQSGDVISRMFNSGDIPNPQTVKSMYITGSECQSAPGVYSTSSTAATDCTPDQPPNAPLLVSPNQGFGIRHEPPTLFWESGGDPDDSQLDFQVEVFNGSQSVQSGWIQGTSWKPVGLSNTYGTYQWRVQARDPELSISEWSQLRSFSILSPDGLPEINLQTANNNSGDKIFSRETTWTFFGIANDPEGQLNRVEFRCTGDSCGSQTTHTGLTTWSHTQTNLSGQNEVYFVAYDNYTANSTSGQSTASRKITLMIDLAPPVTSLSLNGQSDSTQWPTWFTGPVKISLNAVDQGTGHATAGMGKIHYRLDGGSWQTVSAGNASMTVHSDGSHAVEYYSEDALGNVETSRLFQFKIDQTPPSLPLELQEQHGLANAQWQKNQNTPAFAWGAASDATSGVRGYQFYFGEDPNGIGYRNILASEPLQWTPFPDGLPTGIFYLRARTQDNAGNWSAWATLFIFRFDSTPPENPSDVIHAAGISTAWQNRTHTADFSWTPAHDEGAGIKGYYVYWGSAPNDTSNTFITINSFKDLSSLCDANSACTGYLRVRSEDNVGNLAEEWSTVFILRYDNAPPSVDFSFNGGSSETSRTQVTVDVTAQDEGSGIHAIHFSADGQQWTEWEEPASGRLWNIPPINRQSWPVFVQVQDQVGLVSDIVRHDVYLEINQERPGSINYQIFDQSLSSGSNSYDSANYSGHGTVGQVTDSPFASSASYILWSGYEAGSDAIPLIVPGHEEYTFLQGTTASGVAANSLHSVSYQMLLTMGDIGLPATTTIQSGTYQHQPGYMAGIQIHPSTSVDPTTVAQVEMPAPAQVPEPACDAPSISINNGASYTDTRYVTLDLCAPFAAEMMISTEEDFAGAAWERYTPMRSWTLVTSALTVEPHFVYVKFKDAVGNIHTTFFDDILYDPNRPSGSLLLSDDVSAEASQEAAAQMSTMSLDQPTTIVNDTSPAVLPVAADGTVKLYINGYDDNSGLVEMQLNTEPTFNDSQWQAFLPVVNYVPDGEDGVKTVYARFRDEAGNLSATSVIDFVYDTQPPTGYIFANPAVLPVDSTTITLYVGDYGYWNEYFDEIQTDPVFEGGAVEMRLGSDPELLNAYWQPLVESIELSIDPTQTQGTFYVQYRDAAGNVSDVYSTGYHVDSIAPSLSAAAELGEVNTRLLNIVAEDNLSEIVTLYLSNDPLFEQDVVTTPFTETLPWTFDDRMVVWIVAEDGVGNRTEPYPVYASAYLSAAIPVVRSVTRASMSPTSSAQVNFTVKFSEPVTGIVTSAPFPNFALATSGVTGAVITSISGSGSTYTVTVSAGSGDGSIRLDVIDDDTILDNTRIALGGAGSGNGSYTGSDEYVISKTPPELIAPNSSANLPSLRPDFDWSEMFAATSYTVQVSRDSSFVQLVASETSETSSLSLSKDLPQGTKLYWRVRADGVGGSNVWSNIYQITTPTPPGIPILVSPRSGAVTMEYQPLLKWKQVFLPRGTEFSHYQIQISADPGFSGLVLDETIPDVSNTMFTPDSALNFRTQFYWRLRAFNKDNEYSSWSEVRSFTIPAPLAEKGRPRVLSVDPTIPLPVLLGDEISANKLRPILDWTNVSNATSYIIQVSTDPSFTFATLVVSATTIDSQYAFIENKPEGVNLYWRVLVVQGNSLSDWTATAISPP